jgi:hypothetical protein
VLQEILHDAYTVANVAARCLSVSALYGLPLTPQIGAYLSRFCGPEVGRMRALTSVCCWMKRLIPGKQLTKHLVILRNAQNIDVEYGLESVIDLDVFAVTINPTKRFVTNGRSTADRSLAFNPNGRRDSIY